LQAALGPVGTVTIETKHPLLAEIGRRGFRQALDAYKDSAPAKVHFLLVDFVDGHYDLQGAQFDGRTGIATPVVRHARLDDPADRPLVARTAALLVERDFGIVGSVTEAKDLTRVRVSLIGQGGGVNLDRWVKKDDVFAVSQVTRSGSQRVPEAYLQVIEAPRDGVCTCRLVARYADAASRLAEAPGVVGYRCLKLGTTEGPLRLRVVDEQGGPQTRAQARVSAMGLDPKKDDFKPAGAPDREGLVRVDRLFNQIAFVRLESDGVPVAQMVVPILEDFTPVCRVSIDPGNELIGELTQQRQRYLTRVTEALLLQANLATNLRDSITKGNPEEAQEKARTSLAEQEIELKNLQKELESLKDTFRDAKVPPATRARLRLDEAEQRLRQVENGCQNVKKFLADIEASAKDDLKKKEVKQLFARAELQFQEARFDDAIRIFDEARTKAGELNKEVARSLTDLIDTEAKKIKDVWLVKLDDEHRKARVLLYETLPKVSAFDRLKEAVDQAPAALEVCKKHGDTLTPRKLIAAGTTTSLLQLLERERNGLRNESEDDRQRLNAIREVSEKLDKLLQDVQAYVHPPKK
jgi:hypothetical protein